MGKKLTKKQIAAGFGGKKKTSRRKSGSSKKGGRRRGVKSIAIGSMLPALNIGQAVVRAGIAARSGGPKGVAGAVVDEAADQLIGMPVGLTRKEPWDWRKPAVNLIALPIAGKVIHTAAQRTGINRMLRKLKVGRKAVVL